MMLKPRDRVRIALSHEQPDRVPMYLSWVPEFRSRLAKVLGLETSDLMGDDGRWLYTLERTMGADMLVKHCGWVSTGYYQPGYDQPGAEYVDEWGVTWKSTLYDTPYGTGYYTEIYDNPIKSQADLEIYQPPDPLRPELYTDVQRIVKEFGDQYWICAAMLATTFESAWALHGLEQTLIDVVADPELAESVIDIPFRYHLTMGCRLAELGVDMIWLGDDVGGQHGMLISPRTWRRLIKPRLAELISSFKRVNPDLLVALHTCGNVLPIIPELIEVGLDVLNPIQPAAMSPGELKKKFGDNLSFFGAVDEQHTLPFGTKDDVMREVTELIEIVGKEGGFIIAPAHHIQLDTPMENLWAMVETVTGTIPTDYEHLQAVEQSVR